MMTYANLSLPYVVHELLWPHEYATPHAHTPDAVLPTFNVEQSAPTSGGASDHLSEHYIGAVQGPSRCVPVVPPGEMELPGMDFRLDEASA